MPGGSRVICLELVCGCGQAPKEKFAPAGWGGGHISQLVPLHVGRHEAQARWGRVEIGLFAHVRNHYQSGGGGMGRQDK